jgi:hypothetical protein
MGTETPLNRGAELLRDVGSLSEIAAELSVTPRVVSSWRAGKIPSDDNQTALQASYEIPRRAWREPALHPEPARQRAHPPEPHWSIPQRTPWLTFGHPLGHLTVRRHALAGIDTPATNDELEALDAEYEALRARHPALVAACEAAERELGLALAAEAEGDECAARFLRFHGREGASNAAA